MNNPIGILKIPSVSLIGGIRCHFHCRLYVRVQDCTRWVKKYVGLLCESIKQLNSTSGNGEYGNKFK